MRVLLSPLDWGLGHATRSIPIIRKLQEKGCEVLLAGSGLSGMLLQKEFPKLEYRELPDYKLRYSKKVPLPLQLLKMTPKVYSLIQQERSLVQSWEKRGDFDRLISDNRFGCETAKKPSAFITHQLRVLAPSYAPGAQSFASMLHKRYWSRHPFIWVPDFAEAPGISGKLSHGISTNAPIRYLGSLSRLQKQKETKKFKLCILLSGLEPHRSTWEESLIEQLPANWSKEEMVLVRGRPDLEEIPEKWAQKITIHNFLNTEELQKVLSQSEKVVCRSGYSSIMDLIALDLPAAFCPTPGQTEQEYLAQSLHQNQNYYSELQKDFSLTRVLKKMDDYHPLQNRQGQDLLDKAIEELLNA